ncbi:MAG TPA: hypothetical protein VMW04_01915 [Patescibacteria group bacterium]|nr:hypothetical protein [Patescibacteria group bacterium]
MIEHYYPGSRQTGTSEGSGKSDARRPRKSQEIVEKVNQVLAAIPDVPGDLRRAVEEWSPNLFGLEYIREVGYQSYLDSDSSLEQIWGAAALLADGVDAARGEGRSLNEDEIEEARRAFVEAAEKRGETPGYSHQKGELMTIANNTVIIAAIMERLSSPAVK